MLSNSIVRFVLLLVVTALLGRVMARLLSSIFGSRKSNEPGARNSDRSAMRSEQTEAPTTDELDELDLDDLDEEHLDEPEDMIEFEEEIEPAIAEIEPSTHDDQSHKKIEFKNPKVNRVVDSTMLGGAPSVRAKDDLTKLKGVSVKLAHIFETAGVRTFRSLASKTEAELNGIMDAAGVPQTVRNVASWSRQAKLAANHEWEELEHLQRSL